MYNARTAEGRVLTKEFEFLVYGEQKKKKSSCGFRHPPVCLTFKSEIGCSYGKRCLYRHVDAEEKPSKRSKKEGTQGAVAILDPKKSILRKD